MATTQQKIELTLDAKEFCDALRAATAALEAARLDLNLAKRKPKKKKQ